jgi:hypothetical protein
MKQKLIETLYPQDDSEFSDYPEVRKPVKVERAIYALPLIEQEYIPEITKDVSEEFNYKSTILF